VPRYSGTSSRAAGKVTPLTETWRIDQSTAVESEEEGDAMVALDPCAGLVRGLPQSGPLGGSAGKHGTSGQGFGGGIYIDTGAVVTLSKATEVVFNFASTSDDDIFGSYTTS